ncbi:diguanylate cyclase [Wenzhouxiangella limi]|uniref:Diguanylate cyclase n=1 Tax=Wenzhouxiangella limi TaxID=2707351 RepID=A0A845UXW3_9GAMM|nr:diguanylate cyclase [Wenzhouxiangella limi]NDY96267.1 diguanylate cyclase [Wenzhouxiangella limi]
MNNIHKLLCSAFPFHIVLDKSLTVVQTGPSLRKLEGSKWKGKPFLECVEVETPSSTKSYDDIVASGSSVFFLKDHETSVTLKGQWAPFSAKDQDYLIFLCSPVITSQDDIDRLKLNLGDFPKYDSTIDFLVILQTQQNMLTDSRRMAAALKKEIAERKTVQKQLEKARASLEQTVAERTSQLRDANEQLENTIQLLEQRNAEITRLYDLGEMLQGCQTLDAAFTGIARLFARLMPSSLGVIQYRASPKQEMQVVSRWGAATIDKTLLQEVEEPLIFDGIIYGAIWIAYSDAMPDISKSVFVNTSLKQINKALESLHVKGKLHEQSVRDPLTGLSNRRYMLNFFQQQIQKAEKAVDTDWPIGLIMIDIDHFKSFNDRFGHHVGDRVLVELSGLLNRHVRGDDVACRYGGEEFLVILPGAGRIQCAERAERIRTDVSQTLHERLCGPVNEPITISGGVSYYPAHGKTPQALIEYADSRLYAAKRSGRNQIL